MARTCIDRIDLSVAAGLPRCVVNNTMTGWSVRSITLDDIAKALGGDLAELIVEEGSRHITKTKRAGGPPAPRLYGKAYTHFLDRKNKRVAGDSLATGPTTRSTNAQGIVYPLDADKFILSSLRGRSQGGI